jgi:hypothetical protein
VFKVNFRVVKYQASEEKNETIWTSRFNDNSGDQNTVVGVNGPIFVPVFFRKANRDTNTVLSKEERKSVTMLVLAAVSGSALVF